MKIKLEIEIGPEAEKAYLEFARNEVLHAMVPVVPAEIPADLAIAASEHLQAYLGEVGMIVGEHSNQLSISVTATTDDGSLEFTVNR